MSDFILFSPFHLISIFLIGLVVIFSFWIGLRFPQKIKSIQIFYGCLMLGTLVLFYHFHLSRGIFDIGRHLPLHLCSISAYLAMFMCFRPPRQLFWMLYFWGLLAAIITLIIPDMGREDGLASFRFFEIMMTQGLIVVIIGLFLPIYFGTLKLKYLIVTQVLLVLFSLVIGLLINPAVGGNYLYLAQKPSGGQMNFLPQSNPLFALSLASLVLAIIAIQYLITRLLVGWFRLRQLANTPNKF